MALPIGVASDSDIKPIVSLVRRTDASPDFGVTVSGVHTIGNDFNTLSEHDLRSGELRYGLPAALVILVLVFGAVAAGLVPLLTAIVSIVVAMGLVAVLSQAFDLSVFIVNMIVGMGLALGIDYSLFVISRYREERGRGLQEVDAVAAAGATASRAVLFSGSAFVVAVFGMLLVPTTIMRALAAGAIVVGVVSVAAALTLLPAVLGSIGDGVDRARSARSLPGISNCARSQTAPTMRLTHQLPELNSYNKSPLSTEGLGGGYPQGDNFYLCYPSPVFGLHIGASGVQTLPDRLPSKQGYLVLQRDFPQLDPSPARIVIAGAPARSVAQLQARLAGDARFGPGTVRRSRDVTLLVVPVRGDAVGATLVRATGLLPSTKRPQLRSSATYWALKPSGAPHCSAE